MLVVLICKVQKYITAKASMEEYIFYQALYLYQALFMMQQSICDYQKNTEAGVPDNLLLTAHQKFCKKTAIDFQPVLKSNNAVKIAINNVKIYSHTEGCA